MRLTKIALVAMIILVAAAIAGAGAPGSNAAGPTGTLPAFAALGVAQVGGQDVYVHVWVVPPPGASPRAVADQALRDEGARPVDPREVRAERFATNGVVWDQFSDSSSTNNFVLQTFNPAGQPANIPSGSVATAIQNAQTTWNAVATSRFSFAAGGAPGGCPSLVKECPGPQFYDGRNDVQFVPLNGRSTLGVTWYSTLRDEADVALNSKFRWTTTPGTTGYDIETVMLHENGHVAGLGHSAVTGAVMYAYYGGVRRALHQDDCMGISTLYPDGVGPAGC